MSFKPITEELFNELKTNAERVLSLHAEQIKVLQEKLAAYESKSTSRKAPAKSSE